MSGTFVSGSRLISQAEIFLLNSSPRGIQGPALYLSSGGGRLPAHPGLRPAPLPAPGPDPISVPSSRLCLHSHLCLWLLQPRTARAERPGSPFSLSLPTLARQDVSDSLLTGHPGSHWKGHTSSEGPPLSPGFPTLAPGLGFLRTAAEGNL